MKQYQSRLIQVTQILRFTMVVGILLLWPTLPTLAVELENVLPYDNDTLEKVYRHQWQRGHQLAQDNQLSQATLAYQQAIFALEQLRKLSEIDNLPKQEGLKGEELEKVKEEIEKLKGVYYELMDTLFKRYEQTPDQAYLQEILDTAELLKQAELQNALKDDCLQATNTSVADTLEDRTAILYPILFPQGLGITRTLERLFIYSKQVSTLPSLSKGVTDVSEPKPTREKIIKWITATADSATKKALSDKSESDKEDLDTLLNKFLDGLKGGDAPRQVFEKEGQAIYNRLLKSIESDLRNVDTLIFVPDGKLRTIPLVALYDGHEFVIQKNYAVVNIPGLKLTTIEKSTGQTNPRMLLGAMYYSNPQQNTPTVVELSENPKASFSAFSQAGKALQNLESIYGNSKLLMDKEFTIENLQDEILRGGIQPYTIVHLHTHGYFGKTAQDTFLLTDNTKRNQAERLTMDRLQTIFKGGERRGTIELLTLSACSTAEGDDQAILGLAGVAFKSGARSVIAALWQANELVATGLMTRFYTALKQGKTKVRALKEAQQSMIGMYPPGQQDQEQGKHELMLLQKKDELPTYWAPFILIGNWE